jgi:hypothetical protein
MEFPTARAFEHVDKLAYEFGPRIAGERGCDEAAAYIKEELRKLNIPVRVQRFRFVDAKMRARIRSSALIVGILLQLLAPPLLAAVAWAAAALSGWWARPFLPKRESQNLVGTLGDPGAPKALAFVAHYDSARAVGEGRIRWVKRALLLVFTLAVVLNIFAPVKPMVLLSGAALAIALLFSISRKSDLSPGANDNASGVSVLLAAASVLTKKRVPGVCVYIAFTSGEEQGLAGSRKLAESGLIPKHARVLNLDTLGHGTQPYFIEGNGLIFRTRTARELNELLARACRQLKMEIRPWWAAGSRHDHIPFIKHGYAAATLTLDDDAPRPDTVARWLGLPNARRRGYPHTHTPRDLPDKLRPASIERAGKIVLRFLETAGSENFNDLRTESHDS